MDDDGEDKSELLKFGIPTAPHALILINKFKCIRILSELVIYRKNKKTTGSLEGVAHFYLKKMSQDPEDFFFRIQGLRDGKI